MTTKRFPLARVPALTVATMLLVSAVGAAERTVLGENITADW